MYRTSQLKLEIKTTCHTSKTANINSVSTRNNTVWLTTLLQRPHRSRVNEKLQSLGWSCFPTKGAHYLFNLLQLLPHVRMTPKHMDSSAFWVSAITYTPATFTYQCHCLMYRNFHFYVSATTMICPLNFRTPAPFCPLFAYIAHRIDFQLLCPL